MTWRAPCELQVKQHGRAAAVVRVQWRGRGWSEKRYQAGNSSIASRVVLLQVACVSALHSCMQAGQRIQRDCSLAVCRLHGLLA
jgi:hypothetical protein